MPSAPVASSAATSSRSPALTITDMRTPSLVTAGLSLTAAYSARRFWVAASLVSNASSIAGVGRAKTAASPPSSRTRSPSAIGRRTLAIRPIIGTPIARATMVTWAVSEPSSRITPFSLRRSYSSNSAGPRLRAISIASCGMPALAAVPSWPETMRSSRFDRSSRSCIRSCEQRIVDLAHALLHALADALDRRLGGEAAVDRLVDPPRPALVIGEHLVGLEHLLMLADRAELGRAHHRVDLLAHLARRPNRRGGARPRYRRRRYARSGCAAGDRRRGPWPCRRRASGRRAAGCRRRGPPRRQRGAVGEAGIGDQLAKAPSPRSAAPRSRARHSRAARHAGRRARRSPAPCG